MKKCIFCPQRADSLEHVIPKWIYRAVSPETNGAFPVTIGRYIVGKSPNDVRSQISHAFKARIVCGRCNNGWMSELELRVVNLLKELISVPFPKQGNLFLDQLRQDAEHIALWLAKTAVTTSYALPGKQRVPDILSTIVAQRVAPKGVWIDVARAKTVGIGAALSKTFITFNGGVYTGPQTHNEGGCFQFCLQINHLLLRVGMSPGAEVGYVAFGGLNPFRLFPDPDLRVPEHLEYSDLNHFFHSVVLRTWAGCEGEVPTSQSLNCGGVL